VIVIELPGEPKGKGRPRFGRGRAYTPADTRSYEEALAWEGRRVMGSRQPLDGPLCVRIEAKRSKPPTAKPDADNIGKMADALNGIVWRDDCQIVDMRIIKTRADVPSLTITVEPSA